MIEFWEGYALPGILIVADILAITVPLLLSVAYLTYAERKVLAAMYDTPEWEAVRARNGWVNIHNSGETFRAFLENQEKVIGDLMKKLGFL